MKRFNCHGRLHITPHNGVAIVKIAHHQSHKSYVNIDLPEKWRIYIKKHHKMGSNWTVFVGGAGTAAGEKEDDDATS